MENKSQNKTLIENVNLTGGIIGLLTDSPHQKLNKLADEISLKGWRIVQIIPAANPNLLLWFLRILLLIFTFGLYTTAEGYYVVIEKRK